MHCPWFWSLTWHAGGEGGGGGADEGDGVGGLGVRLVVSGGRLGEGGAEGVGCTLASSNRLGCSIRLETTPSLAQSLVCVPSLPY